ASGFIHDPYQIAPPHVTTRPAALQPSTPQDPPRNSPSSARATCRPPQQFGSKTLTSAPAASSTPARRHTPSGGARKVYSPQCGSYGPISRMRGESTNRDALLAAVSACA